MVPVDIKALGYWIKKESNSCKFFKKLCWKNYRIFCNRCKGYNIYSLSNKRYRCKRCGYTFSDFTGRWLNLLKIPKRDWLYILKLFELEISAHKVSKEIDLSYPTVLKGYNIIRRAILAQDEDISLLKGEIEADDTYFGGKRKGKAWKGSRR
jgi:transposase